VEVVWYDQGEQAGDCVSVAGQMLGMDAFGGIPRLSMYDLYNRLHWVGPKAHDGVVAVTGGIQLTKVVEDVTYVTIVFITLVGVNVPRATGIPLVVRYLEA
jgi:hypothetical protein